MGSAPVKFSDLSDAFDFVYSGAAADVNAEAYILLDTGKIYTGGPTP